MGNCIYGESAQTQLNLQCMPGYAILEDNYFVTTPMPVVHFVSLQQNEYEEELYTSFEAAISTRVERVNYQLSLLISTSGHPPTVQPQCLTGRFLQAVSRSACFWQRQRHAISMICLGLSLLLLGFDLMGLLMLWR